MRPKVSGFLFISLLCCVCLGSQAGRGMWAAVIHPRGSPAEGSVTRSPGSLALAAPKRRSPWDWEGEGDCGRCGCDGCAEVREPKLHGKRLRTGGQDRGVPVTWPWPRQQLVVRSIFRKLGCGSAPPDPPSVCQDLTPFLCKLGSVVCVIFATCDSFLFFFLTQLVQIGPMKNENPQISFPIIVLWHPSPGCMWTRKPTCTAPATQPVRSLEFLSRWEACSQEARPPLPTPCPLAAGCCLHGFLSRIQLAWSPLLGRMAWEHFSASTFLSVSWVTPPLEVGISLSPEAALQSLAHVMWVGPSLLAWVHFPSITPLRKLSFLIPRPPSGVYEVSLLYSFSNGNLWSFNNISNWFRGLDQHQIYRSSL